MEHGGAWTVGAILLKRDDNETLEVLKDIMMNFLSPFLFCSKIELFVHYGAASIRPYRVEENSTTVVFLHFYLDTRLTKISEETFLILLISCFMFLTFLRYFLSSALSQSICELGKLILTTYYLSAAEVSREQVWPSPVDAT